MVSPQENVKYDYTFKVVMVGSCGVGKTQLVSRFTKDEFAENYLETIGVEFTTMSTVIDGKNIAVPIWDTNGEEKYKALTGIYYRGAVGAVMVYDVTRKETFAAVRDSWEDELRSHADTNVVIMLVGNKCDVKEKREVNKDEALDLAQRNGDSLE
eukprot:TRINITY_DN7648_c0_g1_i3.p1 TRINITY_DN7648_c0_g1~~TRINITY_DN7648_c0_g1_i3.p1  ORF type:complete len:155 (+),score=53.28 TRINITY_DN7648_c0_g1_i3:157-621(+)